MEQMPTNVKVDISTSTFLRIILLSMLVVAFIKLTSVVLIVLTSIVLASFVQSAATRLQKIIKNRTLAVFCIYIATTFLFAGIFSVFVPVFIDEMSSLVSQLGNYIPANSIFNSFQPETINGAKTVVTDISQNASLSDVITSTQSLVSSLSGGFLDIFGQAFGGLLNLSLIVIISFYLSIKEKGIENFLRIIIPDKSEEYVIDLWSRTETKIGLWIQGQLLLGLIMGVLTYLGLTVLGVKYSFVLALVTALCELIPFGVFLAIIPAVTFGYLNSGITIAVLTFVLYMILHQFENYLIYPLIIKKVIGISPLVVILSLLIGAELAGVWGVILAIPCAVFMFEFLDDVERKKISLYSK